MDILPPPPPPPYAEVDPSQALSSGSVTTNGGDYSPSSTLRPTSSQSLRAPSFITLRGGYLRGVTFSDDEGTSDYFQDRGFQFDPNRELSVVHMDITADTDRADLTYPKMERDRDVTEQDWHTFVNYILTELGNEISSISARKRLSEVEFHLRKTSLDQLISEWNEAFFQPRSIKFVAHYYYTRPSSPAPTYRSRRAEAAPGLRRITVEDGTENLGPAEHKHPFTGYNTSLFNHRGIPFRRGTSFVRGARHRCGNSGNLSSTAGGTLGNMIGPTQPGYEIAYSNGIYSGRGRSMGHSVHRRNDSTSSNSSKSSDSETEANNDVREWGRGDYRGRRGHRNPVRQHRSTSISSDSSVSSVSSISSGEINEHTIGPVRDAIADFRLDPTKHKHNRIAYRQLIHSVREEKRAALQTRPTDRQEIRKVSKAQRKAIRDDLRGLRTEIRQICKETRIQRKTAQEEAQALRRESKRAHKDARKVVREAEKAARKCVKNRCGSSQGSRPRTQTSRHIPSPPHVMPGSFPSAFSPETEHEVQELEKEIEHLEKHVEFINKKAHRDAKSITQLEKLTLTLASYDQEKRDTREEITVLRNEISNIRGTTIASETIHEVRSYPPIIDRLLSIPTGYATRVLQQGGQLERQTEDWGARLGRDMENWGQNFGKDMERWGEEFGRRMSERGQQIGQRFG